MKLKERNGILIPAKMKYRSWIVLGPPGAGKSHLIDRIRGWPEEICIDVSQKRWWAVEPLSHRPREIHLSLPFQGSDQGLCVYDDRWREAGEYPEPELERIRIPHKKKFILAPDWRARFVFDFILPPPAWILKKRRERLASDDMRLVDMGITPEWVEWQVHTHWKVAQHFHHSGLQVMVRPFNSARPFPFAVLKKTLRIKRDADVKEITPETDWSKVRHIKHWIEEIAPRKRKDSGLNEPAIEAETPAPPTFRSDPANSAIAGYGQVIFSGLSGGLRQKEPDSTPLQKVS